ncbi:MAG TPA: S53 family peptidase [Thermoleophilaceae bacterium]|jgi:subtilase family serine protease
MNRSLRAPWKLAALGAAAIAALAVPASARAVTTAQRTGLAPILVSGGTDQGALPAQTLHVTIALSPRNQSALDRVVRGHQTISGATYNSTYAPAQSTVTAVTSWASANGLSVSSVSPNRTLVQLSGSSTAFGKALGITFERYSSSSGSYFTPKGTAKLPSSFAGQVAGVLGLSSIGKLSLPPKRTPANSTQAAGGINYPADYGPQDFWTLYNAPSTATGSGQQVAVIAEGDLTIPKQDLVKFEQQFGLPQVPVTQTTVGAPSSDTAGNDEWDLDTQYSTGFAPDVSGLHLYVGASLSNDDILATVNRWVTDNTNKQASFSAGECELLAQVSGFQEPLDNALEQAAAQGQTLFTSSGDTGSFCPAVIGVNGVPAGLPGTNFPAASPFAMGVGGTTVLGPGPNEIAWYAGGGGLTFFEAVPAYQSNAGGSFLPINRGVPDVALDADPNSGYRVIVGGSEEIIGGTSASAPSWQGIWARAQGAHGGSLGFAGPVIYNTVPASAFNDITVGAIGFYAATPGWDYTTGRGTPNISAFVSGA